jgi:hypothetical protein
MSSSDKRDRLTGAAAILVIPLAMLPAALDFNLDVQTVVRWVVAAGLVLAAAVVTRAVLRGRRSRHSAA